MAVNNLVDRLTTISVSLDAVRKAMKYTEKSSRFEIPWMHKFENVQEQVDKLLDDVAGHEVDPGDAFPP